MHPCHWESERTDVQLREQSGCFLTPDKLAMFQRQSGWCWGVKHLGRGSPAGSVELPVSFRKAREDFLATRDVVRVLVGFCAGG